MLENDKILNDITDLYSRSLKLKGAHDQLLKRRTSITGKVSLDKRLVELQPEVTEILDELQNTAHQRSVGAYERMLTAIVDDVLGDNGKKIAFEMKISRGVPSLFVSIDNNGNAEDIMDGQGGSVANVVSTGLRYIALSRLSEHRKFVLLDEPDCWLSPDKIPAYFNVLNKLSKEIGIQSIVISHHDRASFGDASVVRVSVDEDDNTVEASNLTEVEWEKDKKGIRKVRLFNYMSHEFTEFDLSPGVTVISGENNIGKSAIVSAIRAVAYNEGKDHMVKHGEEDCCVEIFIENNLIIRWTRKRKGKDKTKYELLTTSGELLHEECNGHTVPVWCESVLGIKKINDIDVHISHQKIPMFMISESPAKRAEILSMGKESQYLQKMISLHKDDLRLSKLSIKNGEKEVTSLNSTIDSLSDAGSMFVNVEKRMMEARKLSKFKENDIILDRLIKNIDHNSLLINELSNIDNIVTPEIFPIHEDCLLLSTTIKNIKNLIQLNNLSLDEEEPSVPEIYDCVGLIKIGMNIKDICNLIVNLELQENVSIPELPELNIEDGIALSKMIENLDEILIYGKGLSSDRTKLVGKIESIDSDIEKLIEESGGMCPLCGNELTEEHFLEKSNNHVELSVSSKPKI